MECFAAVIISIVVIIHQQWAMTDWLPLRHPWPDIPLVLIALKLRAVMLLNNIVMKVYELIVVIRLFMSVTLGGVTRLIGRGVELCRYGAGLTFLNTFEPPVQ